MRRLLGRFWSYSLKSGEKERFSCAANYKSRIGLWESSRIKKKSLTKGLRIIVQPSQTLLINGMINLMTSSLALYKKNSRMNMVDPENGAYNWRVLMSVVRGDSPEGREKETWFSLDTISGCAIFPTLQSKNLIFNSHQSL